jgi:DNA repair protein RadA/Sms
MSKKSSYVCQTCGMLYPKWQGKCAGCNSWNSIVEELITLNSTGLAIKSSNNVPISIEEILYENHSRIALNDEEFNRVLGGGLVLGSLVLIGGEPGIGKSTLILQLVLDIGISGKRVLYISGEESAAQIKMRANRLGKKYDNCYVFAENCLEIILKEAANMKPDVIVIDSIQTIYSSSIEAATGSISQVRACTMALMEFAKNMNIAIFIIGHITKEGTLAGPKVLEHMVDVVLQFEGENNMSYRIVRTIKNRFGPASELGVYQMYTHGLKQVSNPSEVFLSNRTISANGVAIGTCMEGNRCIMVEVQALISRATYSSPQRSTTGFDIKRLHMLLAVLEKIIGLKIIMQDVFLNIVGGLKITDTSLDLPVCIAMISSFYNKKVSQNICFAGEIGLNGELRNIMNIEKRIKEADRLGFNTIYVPHHSDNTFILNKTKIEVKRINNLLELVKQLFQGK